MTKEEHDKIIDFVNSEDYMLLNSYISKPYEETIIEQDKEIERLNHECDTYLKIATKRKNIIDELEKLIDSYELGKYDYEIPVVILKDKLKELKGNKK